MNINLDQSVFFSTSSKTGLGLASTGCKTGLTIDSSQGKFEVFSHEGFSFEDLSSKGCSPGFCKLIIDI